jgi:hypothetical protein
MAITLTNLKSLMERSQARIFTDENDTLLYVFAHQGQMILIDIQLLENGEYVRFRIPMFLSLAGVKDVPGFLTKLLELNYQYKLLKFSCDPRDGEVTVSIEIPLEDGALTESQMDRCMQYMTNLAMQESDRLRTLISTGIYPSSEDANFTDTLSRLLGDEDTMEGGSEEPAADCPSLFDELDIPAEGAMSEGSGDAGEAA